MVQPQTLGTIPPGQTSEPAVATLTGNDLSFAEGLVRSGYLQPTAVPSSPTGVNPTAQVATPPRRTRTVRARIGDVQPRRGLRDTPTVTARGPQLGQPDLPTTKYSITVGVRGGNIPKLWFHRFVEFLKEKAVAGAASIEIGGEPKVFQQTQVATSINSTIASIENLLVVQGEPSACMCKVSCLHMAWPPKPFVMIWSSN